MNIDTICPDEIVRKRIEEAEAKYRAKTKNSKESRFAVVRLLFLVAGFLSLVLGVTGIFLPILPTVPFFLLTAACLARGSKRFGDWFVSTTLYRRRLLVFIKYRVMTLSSELFTLTFICALFIISCIMSGSLVMAIIGPVVGGVHIVYFVLTITPISSVKMKMIYAYEDAIAGGERI